MCGVLFFFLAVVGARGGGGGGGEGDELCSPPIAVYAHDPALIPEQAHSNMAACTTTERGEELWKGGRLTRLFDSARSFPSLCWLFATSSGEFLQVPSAGCCSIKIIRSLLSRPPACQPFKSFTLVSVKQSNSDRNSVSFQRTDYFAWAH